MRALSDDEETYEIPLTPLIDIVFLLVIFFLVSATFLRKEVDQQVKLAEAEGESTGGRQAEELVINVRRAGVVVVNGRILSLEELRGALAKKMEEAEEGAAPRASLRADKDVRWDSVAKVIGLCRAEGIANLDLPVIPPGEGNGASPPTP